MSAVVDERVVEMRFNNKDFENVAYFEPFYLKEFQGVKKKKAE